MNIKEYKHFIYKLKLDDWISPNYNADTEKECYAQIRYDDEVHLTIGREYGATMTKEEFIEFTLNETDICNYKNWKACGPCY